MLRSQKAWLRLCLKSKGSPSFSGAPFDFHSRAQGLEQLLTPNPQLGEVQTRAVSSLPGKRGKQGQLERSLQFCAQKWIQLRALGLRDMAGTRKDTGFSIAKCCKPGQPGQTAKFMLCKCPIALCPRFLSSAPKAPSAHSKLLLPETYFHRRHALACYL